MICIYHKNCADGMTAAWAVHHAFKRTTTHIEYVPMQYGDTPPDVRGEDVVMVDFSLKHDALIQMADEGGARSILILDHHASAEAELKDIRPPHATWKQHMHETFEMSKFDVSPIRAFFDINRSGGQLAWDYFHDSPRPKIVDYTADYDLWRFEMLESKLVNLYLSTYDKTLENWDELAAAMEYPNTLEGFITGGRSIQRKRDQDIAAIVSNPLQNMIIGGQSVQVANAPGFMASELGHILSEGHAFAATYFDMDGQRVFSLRSAKKGGADVSKIAALYGGGGHKNAAGFKMDLGWSGDTD